MRTSSIIAIAVIILLPILAFVFTRLVPHASTDSYATNGSTLASPTATAATPTAVAATPSTSSAESTPPADAVSANAVVLKTDKGDIHLTLFPDKAPLTVTNFVTLGKRGYYNGIIFHRVIKDFVIQAGDPTGTGRGGASIYGATFKDEISDQKIVVGTLAMANAGKNTNGSQFFIVTQQDQPSLDGSYTVFGKVSDEASMNVVKAIAAVPTDSTSKPTTDVKITGMDILSQ